MSNIFIFVLFIVGYVFCDSVFRNDSEPFFQKLNRAVPDLAPFDEDIRVDPLSGLDPVRRAYIRRLFSGAFYELCIRKGYTVKPVYYWPGERVDLPCKMCTREAAYNGKMKYWSFIRQKFINDYNRLDQLPSTEWTRLDENYTRVFRPRHLLWEISVYMPAFYAKARRNETHRNFRPPMTFVQRDGRLKILTAESNAYGLYRCFDDSDRDTVSFVYHLIPITPVFHTDFIETFRYECQSRAADFNSRFFRFDAMHRFRVVSPNAWNKWARNFYPADWRNMSIDEAAFSLNYFSETTKDHPVLTLKATGYSKQDIIDLPMNLKIFVHWSEWSKCDSVRRYRTRQGYCHIGKVKSNIKFLPTDEETSIIRAKGIDFFMQIHKMLETVDEFRRDGIPLFSGVFAHIIAGEGESSKPVTQCADSLFLTKNKTYKDNFNWVKKLVFDPLKATSYRIHYNFPRSGMESHIDQNPCYYYNSSRVLSRFGAHLQVMYGFPLIQNEECWS